MDDDLNLGPSGPTDPGATGPKAGRRARLGLGRRRAEASPVPPTPTDAGAGTPTPVGAEGGSAEAFAKSDTLQSATLDPPSNTMSGNLMEEPSTNKDGDTAADADESGPPRRAVPAGGFMVESSSAGETGTGEVAAGGKSGKFTGVSRRKAAQLEAEAEEQAGGGRQRRKYEAKEETIMEIPTLEDEGREDLSTVVAEAPKVRVNKVQKLSELELEMGTTFDKPPDNDDDIDLSMLTQALLPSDMIEEPDVEWRAEVLLTEVISDITKEKEAAEAEAEAEDA